jgi:hypothetical protein
MAAACLGTIYHGWVTYLEGKAFFVSVPIFPLSYDKVNENSDSRVCQTKEIKEWAGDHDMPKLCLLEKAGINTAHTPILGHKELTQVLQNVR